MQWNGFLSNNFLTEQTGQLLRIQEAVRCFKLCYSIRNKTALDNVHRYDMLRLVYSGVPAVYHHSDTKRVKRLIFFESKKIRLLVQLVIGDPDPIRSQIDPIMNNDFRWFSTVVLYRVVPYPKLPIKYTYTVINYYFCKATKYYNSTVQCTVVHSAYYNCIWK